MKAAIWHGSQDVRIESVSEPPAPAPGQVQVKVAWYGICGTDLHEYVGDPLSILVDWPHPITAVQAPVFAQGRVGAEDNVAIVGAGMVQGPDRLMAARIAVQET